MATIKLELDSYEAANLICLLDALYSPHARGPSINENGKDRKLQEFNTGDWVGQISPKLAQAIIKGGTSFINTEANQIYQELDQPLTRDILRKYGSACPHCGLVI